MTTYRAFALSERGSLKASFVVGAERRTKRGAYYTIVRLVGNNYEIQFKETSSLRVVNYQQLVSNYIKDLAVKNKYGGTLKVKTQQTALYSMWYTMLRRASEAGVTVCDDFLDYEKFQLWAESQTRKPSWILDRSWINPKAKLISPDTCCFAPLPIARLLKVSTRNYRINDSGRYVTAVSTFGVCTYIGTYKTKEEALVAYKRCKEFQIQRVAGEWQGIIDDRLYQAMLNYRVEI